MDLVKCAKSNLRIELKRKLLQMTPYEIAEQSRIITNKLLIHPIYTNSNRVSVYVSMDSEVQTTDIINDVFDSGKVCYIPKYNQSNMSMVKIKSIEDLKSLPKTKWNISQPADNDIREDALATGGLDLIIVPGLGFTINGKRLGRGKGYYDRCLTEYKQLYPSKNLKTIGLAFSRQLCNDIPLGPLDSMIDIVMYP